MKFSRENGSNLLCSCSSDLVIVWNIKQLNESINFSSIFEIISNLIKLIFKAKFLQGKNTIIENLNHEPTQCCFHPNNQIIGISFGEKICLFDINVSFIQIHKKNIRNLEIYIILLTDDKISN